MNKRIPFLAVAALAIGLLTGCQTNSTPLTPEEKSAQTMRRATRIAEMATFDAGILALKEKNNTTENRAVLAGITNQLVGFLNASNITSADVSSYIAQLPIKELKTVEGQLIAGAVVTIVDEVVGDTIRIDTGRLNPVIAAAIKGFGRAIQFAESNPYVPPAPKPPKNTNAVPAKTALLPPLPQPDIAMELTRPNTKGKSFSMLANNLTLRWQGNPTNNYVIETSVDLVNWAAMVTASGNTFTFMPAGAKLFYRVLADAGLEWDPSPATWTDTEGQLGEAGAVYNYGGYLVYIGRVSRLYDEVVDVGNVTRCSLAKLLPPTTYYFAVTAYLENHRLESDYSEEGWYTPNVIPLAITRS